MSYVDVLNEELKKNFTLQKTELDLSLAHPAGISEFFIAGEITFEKLFRNDKVHSELKEQFEKIQKNSAENESSFSKSFAKLVIGKCKLSDDSVSCPILLRPIKIVSEKIILSKVAYLSDEIIELLKANNINIKHETVQKEASNNSVPTKLFNELYRILVKSHKNISISKNLSIEFISKKLELPFFDDSIYSSIFFELSNAENPESINISANGEIVRKVPNPKTPIDIHFERGIGELNTSQNYAVNTAALGSSFILLSESEKSCNDTVSGIIADAVGSNKKVGISFKSKRMQENVEKTLLDSGISVVDSYGIQKVGKENEILDKETIREIRNALIITEQNIDKYFETLFTKNPNWNFSLSDAYLEMNNCTNSKLLGDFTLGENALKKIVDYGIDNTANALQEYFDKGFFDTSANLWSSSNIYSADDLEKATETLNSLNDFETAFNTISDDLLKAGYVDITGKSLSQINEIIELSKNVNSMLDKFNSDIFEQDLLIFVDAFKGEKKIKYFDRVKLKKAFKEFYIPGMKKSNAYNDLLELKELKDLWNKFSASASAPLRIENPTLDLFGKNYNSIKSLMKFFPKSFDLTKLSIEEILLKIKALKKEKVNPSKNKTLNMIEELGLGQYLLEIAKNTNVNSANIGNTVSKNIKYIFYKSIIKNAYLTDNSLNIDIKQTISNYNKLLNANLEIKKSLIFNAVNQNGQVVNYIGIGQKPELYKTTNFDLVIINKVENIAELLYLTQNTKQVILINPVIKVDLLEIDVKESNRKIANWNKVITELNL